MDTPSAAAAMATAGAEIAAPTEIARPRVSILLVDDQPARLLTYEAILAGLEIDCVRAASGKEALKLLLSKDFALILLDVNMPEMDGFETARLIREHPRWERTPIIFVTGVHVSNFDQLKGYEVGAIDYIPVPVVPEILRSKVSVLVELHQRRRHLEALNTSLTRARTELETRHASAMAERDAQLQAIFEHPTELIAVLQAVRDADGSIVDWQYRDANKNTLELLGVARDELLGRRLTQVLAAEHANRVSPRCAHVLESRQVVRYEARFGDKDFDVTLFPMGPECVVSSATNITERTRVEAALRHSEARHRALLDNAPVAVAHNSLDGKFEYVNRAFCKLVGYSTDELYTKRWQDITHPEDVTKDQQFTNQIIAGELRDYTVEKRYIRKDGSVVWVNLFGNFVADDNGRAAQDVAVVVDITEQRTAAAELNRSREQLILAQAAAYLGIHDWDIQANTISWDERTREIWGTHPGEAISFEVFADGLHPDDRASTQEAVNKALDPAGDGYYLATFRVINRLNHRVYWVEATGRVIFKDRRAVRLVGTVQDVTERTHAQQLLQESEARFREASERKDEFLAMLSHELRNPAAAIGNAAQALSRLVNRDQERSLVGIVDRQIRHLGRLLDDLLDVSRITRGRIEIDPERLTLQSCIDLALETAQPLIQERQHRLTVEIRSEPLWVDADKVRLAQCISNLLTNAAKYTEPGGEIHVRAFTEDGAAIAEITDTGIGMPPELKPNVFEMFVQGERALDRSQGGLGIGLAVCRMLMEMQGGSVTGSSPGIGRGSTFTLRLPLACGTLRLDHDDATASGGRARVLIVDDNRDAADSLALLLQLEEHATLTAYSAADALIQAATFEPHFVLLDIGLPEMDGYEVARRMRTIVPSARLIAITGYGLAGDRQRSASSGFAAHLVKPVSLDDIQTTFATLAH